MLLSASKFAKGSNSLYECLLRICCNVYFQAYFLHTSCREGKKEKKNEHIRIVSMIMATKHHEKESHGSKINIRVNESAKLDNTLEYSLFVI